MAPVPTLERPDSPSVRDDDTPLIELTDPDELELDGGRMSFLEHLDELRKRLIAGLIGIAIGCVLSFVVLDTYIVPFIMVPMEQMLPQGGTLITTEPTEFFMLWLKMGFFGGLLIAMPFVLYQVWLFVAPGLYSHEKRFAIPFVLFASLFFFGGAAFSHYVAFPVTWGFFIKFNPSFVQFMPKIGPRSPSTSRWRSPVARSSRCRSWCSRSHAWAWSRRSSCCATSSTRC